MIVIYSFGQKEDTESQTKPMTNFIFTDKTKFKNYKRILKISYKIL